MSMKKVKLKFRTIRNKNSADSKKNISNCSNFIQLHALLNIFFVCCLRIILHSKTLKFIILLHCFFKLTQQWDILFKLN